MSLNNSLIFDTIFRNAESTIFIIFDLEGTIEDFNLGFQKLLGYSKASLVGKNVSTIYHEDDDAGEFPQKMIQQTSARGLFHYHRFLKQHGGVSVWTHGECILAKDQHGKEHIVILIDDLNKERLLEQALIEKNKEEEKIMFDQETFVYTTSHDLRSPINNLDGLVQSVEESYNDPDAIRQLIPLLNDSIERLKNKIHELSLIGKMREEENKGSVILFENILNEVLQDLEKEIEASDAEISYDFSQVPEIKFSKKNMRSILHNLVSNSLKYSAPNRKPIIRIETEHFVDDCILLKVKDNGLGIEEKEKEKIFEMYHRVYTHIEGTGVGLAIVEKIVSNAGGKIQLESHVGEGSVFKIYLKAEVVRPTLN